MKPMFWVSIVIEKYDPANDPTELKVVDVATLAQFDSFEKANEYAAKLEETP